MNMDVTAIDALARRLTSDDPSPLSNDERRLLATALAELAASQEVIAKQTRLLQLHGEFRGRINAITADAIAGVASHLDTSNLLETYDFDRAEAARRDLLASIDNANTTRATLAATLTFVRRLIGSGA